MGSLVDEQRICKLEKMSTEISKTRGASQVAQLARAQALSKRAAGSIPT